ERRLVEVGDLRRSREQIGLLPGQAELVPEALEARPESGILRTAPHALLAEARRGAGRDGAVPARARVGHGRLAGAPALAAGPGVLQGHDAVEHEPLARAVHGIAPEVADPLELVA